MPRFRRLVDDEAEQRKDAVLDAGARVTQRKSAPDWIQALGSLCATCTSSQITRRKDDIYYSVYCHNIGRNVPQDIMECSSFTAQNEQSLRDMYGIAKLIDPREQGGQYL